MDSYKHKKVITIGIVNELTGLSERQIRYYEECGLIFPKRSKLGTRHYSFTDIETLIQIADKREEGVQTNEIKRDFNNKKKRSDIRDEMLRGQINSHFNRRR
ncbi:DNA-binding transcriptional regulator, MerR family [Lentibacillus halodurans]|uniref:DNA-binding transcriptional regulator, MerR family n=1 Tax=Lentibacillus halodurans TaxID=237679 RepID=A0A1I0WLI7_9BACI|nr:MerR family transcriptional regulator [Lentibacillus halodurans]SFA89414.1 DNA-binding transcriptional regulator, MerR family [Lentibacillus halodurans]